MHKKLILSVLLTGLMACSTTSPQPQSNTAPLRSGEQVATNVGENTRKTLESNKEIVLYASSIEEKNTSPQAPPKQVDITVYSEPSSAAIIVDGKLQKVQTPTSTLAVSVGKHEVQVKFPDGSTSESKTIYIKDDTSLKLLFTQATPPETPAAEEAPTTTP